MYKPRLVLYVYVSDLSGRSDIITCSSLDDVPTCWHSARVIKEVME
jgi:hypothetical protein